MLKKLKILLCVLGYTGFAIAQNNEWQKLAKTGREFYEKGEYESAYQAFAKAKELAPAASSLDAYMAQSAYRAGKFKEAAEAYQNTREQNPDTWTNYNKGNAQFKNEDLSGAIDSYKEALRKDPTNEVARHNLAQALKKQENQDNQNDQNQDNQNQQDQNQQNQQNQDQQNQQDQNKQDQQNQGDKGDEQDNQNQQEQPKLGRDQTEQLLESMMQADKKAQDKLKDEEKNAVGSGKREKDW
jgi:tetratricopeptide (TPR) repeat protein